MTKKKKLEKEKMKNKKGVDKIEKEQ